jgi:hypothetical protein
VLTENNVTRAEKSFPADPVLTAAAKARVKHVKDKLMPTSCVPLLTMLSYVTRQVYATCFPTLQVQLAADKIPVLGISPEYLMGIDTDQGVMFALFHEALHLIRAHLFDPDMQKRQDDRYVLAQEAWINNYIMKLTKMSLITSKGKVEIVDPKATYDWAKKAAKDQGLTSWPEMKDFYQSEQTAYEWLCQLKKEKRPSQNFCVHKGTDGTTMEDADPTSMTPVIDPGANGDLIEKIIETAVKKAAKENNEQARDELKELLGAAKGNERAEKIFGSLGAYELLGETTPEHKTNLWDHLVRHIIGRLLEPGTRLTINRKRFDQRILVHRGKTRRPEIVIGCDASGSMCGKPLDVLAKLVGKTKAKTHWVSWDGAAQRFSPGEPFVGGGGTDCRVFEQWILDNLKSYPDAVICVTDGYFEHFTPQFPKRWVWLITEPGDPWPQSWTPKMKTVRLPVNEEA